MLYGGILGYSFDELKDEECGYVDKARRVITMPASEVDGLSDGNVTLFFDLLKGELLTVAERIDNIGMDTMSKVDVAVKEFNDSQSRYKAFYEMSPDTNYIDISVSPTALCDAVKDAYE